jgi:hypothetical protein
VILKRDLNYELQQSYGLKVKVVDAAGSSTHSFVEVRVGDVNEQPTFMRSCFENAVATSCFKVSESGGVVQFLESGGTQSNQIQKGTHVGAPLDEDTSITCSNMDTNGGRILAYVRGASLDQIFGVKENTRECERGSGDWAPHSIEVSCGWEISVYADEQCADSNPSRFSGTVVELSEAYSSLSSLYFRVARRSSPVPAQALRYSILSGNSEGLFSLDEDTGMLMLAGFAPVFGGVGDNSVTGPNVFQHSLTALNFESRDRYDIKIEASDNGMPPLSTTTTWSIYVVDANEPPSLADTERFVDESCEACSELGTSITHEGSLLQGGPILGSDPDSKSPTLFGKLDYSIMPSCEHHINVSNSRADAYVCLKTNQVPISADDASKYCYSIGAQLASRDQVETAWENGLDFGDNRIAWIDGGEFVSVPDVIGEPGNHSGGFRSKTSELFFFAFTANERIRSDMFHGKPSRVGSHEIQH